MQNNVVYNKGVIELVSKPKSGDVIKVYTRPEDKIFYKFDIKNTKYRVFGNSIELQFEDDAKFVFVSVMDMLEETNPPLLVLRDGKEVSFETVVLKIGDEEVYSTLIQTQSSFEEKLKLLQTDLANEFKKVEQLKADLIKEKDELYEFKTTKTLTKDATKVILDATQTKESKIQNKQEENKNTQAVLVPESKPEVKVKEVVEPKVVVEPKEVKNDMSLESILSKEDTSKLDEIDSIIRELDIR